MPAAVAVENDIYVFGGFRRLECPSAVHSGHSIKFCGAEVYTSKNDYWVPVQSRYGAPGLCTMSESSCLCGAVYDGEDILVAGDLDVGNHYQAVRAFNRHTNTWHCVVDTLPKHQQRYQVCLLHMPTATFSKLQQQQQQQQQEPEHAHIPID
nr:hypothetical protein BaRGS_033986 [Batillaria attramentaria]